MRSTRTRVYPLQVDGVNELIADVLRVRKTTERLAAPLTSEDCVVQSMPDASPTKWHLAHTTWFYETFVLGGAPYREGWGFLFNSYYEGAGPRHDRARGGMLTRPTLAEVYTYRADVDARIAALRAPTAEQLRALEIGRHHEQQHQELLLTDIKHALAENPLHPAYRSPARAAPQRDAPALGWRAFSAGTREIGHDGAAFAFDNERPRHSVHIAPFEIASRLVTW